jgi:hypothetical protein
MRLRERLDENFLEPSAFVQCLSYIAFEAVVEKSEDIKQRGFSGTISADHDQEWRNVRKMDVAECLEIFNLIDSIFTYFPSNQAATGGVVIDADPASSDSPVLYHALKRPFPSSRPRRPGRAADQARRDCPDERNPENKQCMSSGSWLG